MTDLHKTGYGAPMNGKDELSVRQANALAKSAQQMELSEKRLLLIAMGQIKRTDTEFLTREIPITDVAPWFGGNPYQEAKKAADGLLERVVFIQEDDGGYKKFQWTTLSEYIPANKHKEKRAHIRLRLNEELKPLLLQLKDRFNTIPLAELLPIPSFNSQRLYEVLWADSFAGDKHFISYDISKLKVLLGLRDPEGKWEKYNEWRDFKKVLERAKQDFEEYGALRILSFKGKRFGGRAFSQVLFNLTLIVNKNMPQLPFAANGQTARSPEELLVAQQLEEAGYLQNAFEALDTYGLELVQKTLKLARDAERKAATSSKPIYNLGGLVASLLKGRVAERHEVEEGEHRGLQEADVRRKASTLAFTYNTSRSEWVSERWQEMATEEQEGVHDMMRIELEPFLLRMIESDNWAGAAYESARNSYLLQMLTSDVPDYLLTLEAFVKREGFLVEFEPDDQQRILKAAEEQI